MKKTTVLALVLMLSLLVAAPASAAVHNFTGDFVNPFLLPDYSGIDLDFEGWYYIEKDVPSATVRGAFSDNANAFGSEYFINDQTFANLYYFDPDNDHSLTALKGSYLLDNGFFVGLDLGYSDGDAQNTISPGYRFDLPNKSGYVAASLDYAANDEAYTDTGIIGYEVNARYYTKDSRLFGQIIIPNDDVTWTDETFFNVGGAYKLSENIVLGGQYMQGEGTIPTIWGSDVSTEYNYFDLGLTTTFNQLGIEFKYSNIHIDVYDEDLYSTSLNALYSFTKDIRAGLQIDKVEDFDDPFVTAKLKYTLDKQNDLIFMHQFKNDSHDRLEVDGITYLRWDIKF